MAVYAGNLDTPWDDGCDVLHVLEASSSPDVHSAQTSFVLIRPSCLSFAPYAQRGGATDPLACSSDDSDGIGSHGFLVVAAQCPPVSAETMLSPGRCPDSKRLQASGSENGLESFTVNGNCVEALQVCLCREVIVLIACVAFQSADFN